MKFGNKLSKLRKEHNLSQEQLADKLEVSRQAVSKWESGQSYPEMDKIIILCKLFDCSIDELVNDKEVVGAAKNKRVFMDYVDEFLGFITKTFNMFWSMSFKQKISCIFQMGILVLVLIIIWMILGEIVNSCLYGIYGMLHYSLINFIDSILRFIYVISGMAIISLITIHVFKIRFLDYFVTIEDSEVTEKKIEKPVDDKMGSYEEKESKKIIIRDPKHSTFHFFEILSKLSMLFIKGCAVFISMFFIFSFVLLAFVLMLNLWYIKDGIIFIGFVIGFIGAVLLNYAILELLYNFIISHEEHFKRLFIIGITSLVMIGFGFAISFASYFGTFEKVSNDNTLNATIRKTVHLNKDENIRFHCHEYNYCSKVNYEVDESLNDIIIFDIKHNKNYKYELENYTHSSEAGEDIRYFDIYPYGNYFIDNYKMIIHDLKSKKARDYGYYPNYEVTIYATSSNIEKLKLNN